MDIICLHGMGRTRLSMSKLARHLRLNGHQVHLFGYGQRADLRTAAKSLVVFLRARGLHEGGDTLGFVGHSAGGVLLRYLAAELPTFRAGRSVAIGSPINGSIIAKHFSERRLFQVLCGPILHSLHPHVVAQLPLPPCSLAAIAGRAESKLLPASYLLRTVAKGQASDATVLLEETRLEGITEWIEVPVVHTFLPDAPLVHQLVGRYLKSGRFSNSAEQ